MNLFQLLGYNMIL